MKNKILIYFDLDSIQSMIVSKNKLSIIVLFLSFICKVIFQVLVNFHQ